MTFCQVSIAENRIFGNWQELKTALFRAFNFKKRWFFMLKRALLSTRRGGFSGKKRRFLKLILIFIGIKIVYRSDYQYLLFNAKNKRFSSTDNNAPANIDCMYAQNSRFVDFIHSIRKCTKRRLKPDREMSSTQTM